MAVIEAVAAHRGGSGQISWVPGLEGSWSNSYQIVYNVKTNSISDGPVTIAEYFRVAPNLPYIGDTYLYGSEFDNNAYCIRIASQKKEGSQYEWTTTAFFSVPPDGEDPTKNPLDRRRKYSFDFSPRQVPVYNAAFFGLYRIELATGNKIGLAAATKGYYRGVSVGWEVTPANSAGDTFDPPMLKDESDLVFTATINEESFDADDARDYRNKLNDQHIQLDLTATEYNCILRAYKFQLKCMNIRGDFAVERYYDSTAGEFKEQPYWQKTYEFHLRPGFEFANTDPLGWHEFVLDHGYNRSNRKGDPDGLGGTKPDDPKAGTPYTTRVLSEGGFPVSEKVNLDGNGQPLASSGVSGDPAPVYIEFANNKVKDFTTLPVGFTAWTPP